MSENKDMSNAEYFAKVAGGCVGWAGGVLSGAMLAAAIGFTGGLAIPILGGVAGAVGGVKNPSGAVMRLFNIITK